MYKLIILILVLAFMAMAPAYSAAKSVSLGDINGDGKCEKAVEEISMGASSYSVKVIIMSGTKVVLALPMSTPDAASGYKVIGRQIVYFLGSEVADQSKWDPFYYDFFWYKWEPKLGKYVQSREGFTKKAYTYKAAKTYLPGLAKDPAEKLVQSKGKSFAEDALSFVYKAYGKKTTRYIKQEVGKKDGRGFLVLTTPNYYVYFMRSGKIDVWKPGD